MSEGKKITRTRNLALEKATASIRARAHLKKENLSLPQQPDFDVPVPPRDLAELSDDLLMEMFVDLTVWADFLNIRLAMQEIDEQAANEILSMAEATALLQEWTGAKEDRVTIAKAERMMKPEVMEARQERDQIYAVRKLLKPLYENVERRSTLVSRELSRRTGRREVNERRADRFGNRA